MAASGIAATCAATYKGIVGTGSVEFAGTVAQDGVADTYGVATAG